MPRFPSDFEDLWTIANNIGLKALILREKLKKVEPNYDELSFNASKGLLEGRFQLAKEVLDKLEALLQK